MNIRIVQMNITESVAKNVQKAIVLAQNSTYSLEKKRPNVIIFPEIFICEFDDLEHIKANAISIRETNSSSSEFFSPFQELCHYYNSYLILGSLPINDEGKYYNTSLVFSPQGECIYRYDKINLFPLMNESMVFSPGSQDYENHQNIDSFFLQGLKKDRFKARVRICYDLRFPEIFRETETGHYPEIVFLPMQWPASRTETFQILARTRAIENQAYVIACNRVGSDRNNDFQGGSMAIGPDGNILAQLGSEEGTLDVTLDKVRLDNFRSRYPFLKNYLIDKENSTSAIKKEFIVN